MSDNRRFKTPFFKIQISDAAKKRRVTLPHHILRLVQKVEITEVFQGIGGGSFSNINISILEGSREPASPDSTMGTRGLYKISNDGKGVDMDVAGSTTNRTGIIPDMRFSGTGGLTFLTEGERKEGKIDTRTQKNVEGKKTTRTHPQENRSPLFLFDARNIITVTIGYLEDPKTVREFSGYIANVATNFPENGSPTTDITCLPTGAMMDQIAPTEGITFLEGTKTGPSGVLFQPKTAKVADIIDEICQKSGLVCVRSENLDGDNQDENFPRVWAAGQSLQEFLDKLAKQTNCILEVRTDKEKQDHLFFIKKSDFESRVIISDRKLLTYKGPGSILKNFKITADFAQLIGNSQTNIDKEGDTSTATTTVPLLTPSYNTPKGSNSQEQLAPICPISGPNPIGYLQKIAQEYMTPTKEVNSSQPPSQEADPNVRPICAGTVTMSPGDSTINDSDSTAIEAGKLADRAIVAEFTTVGFTQLTPGVVDIRGIGVRYSGKYRIMSTTHVIESGGYITRCTAKSHAVATGGVKWDEAPKGEENETEGVKLFTDGRSKLDKFQRTGKE
jgi:hypothetical protein